MRISDWSSDVCSSDLTALAQGASLPLLVRFPDVLGGRLRTLQDAFAQAQADWDYAGGYTAAYPIKVHQHRRVAATLAEHAGEGYGLEAGSTHDPLAVSAAPPPGGPGLPHSTTAPQH